MEQILLKDEEIRELPELRGIDSNQMIQYTTIKEQIVAKAQLKKVVEWGNEPCEEHVSLAGRTRRLCPECWQALLKEVE